MGPDADLLNQPSPYHSAYGESDRSPKRIPFPKPSTLFEKFRYARIGHQSAEEEQEYKDDESLAQRKSTSSKASNAREKWFTPLFLLLLISSLLNLFLVFNGPVAVREDYHATGHQQEGQQKVHDGKGMTCHKTHKDVFRPDFDYANVYHSSDHLWTALQGGSYGTVYTDENRVDGKVRVAGIAMFHQLHCLNGFRSAIQQLQEGKKIGYSVFTDVSERRGHWPHCFDYLRQVILCNADDTIETSAIDGGQWSFSGYDSPRLCKDHKKLYDITACGEQGCEGKKYWHNDEEMKWLHAMEEKEVEEWKKEHGKGG